jgi:hypothetical protein
MMPNVFDSDGAGVARHRRGDDLAGQTAMDVSTRLANDVNGVRRERDPYDFDVARRIAFALRQRGYSLLRLQSQSRTPAWNPPSTPRQWQRRGLVLRRRPIARFDKNQRASYARPTRAHAPARHSELTGHGSASLLKVGRTAM